MHTSVFVHSEESSMESSRRRFAVSVSAFACGMAFGISSWADETAVEIPESATVNGAKLSLNGAGIRRRGYSKANVVALYLPTKLTTLDSIARLDGPRRLQIYMLRSYSPAAAGRILLTDFKQAATEDEFKHLINEIAAIGAIYGSINRIQAGDVVTIDWVPEQGIVSSFNDRLLGSGPIKSELAYQIYLRMFIGKNAPVELRNALLGLTASPLKSELPSK